MISHEINIGKYMLKQQNARRSFFISKIIFLYKLAFFLIPSSMLSIGCATGQLVAVPISDTAKKEMNKIEGIPYYIPRPYLLITRNIEISSELVNQIQTDSKTGVYSEKPDEESPPVSSVEKTAQKDQGGYHMKPVYHFKIIYLPDLTRQYALKQKGIAFSKSSLKYELENGWMFKGTEITSESQVPQIIDSVANGVSSVFGSSIEQLISSFSKQPTSISTAGASGVTSYSNDLPLSPKIWIFEISEASGILKINTEKPFFEWPKENKSLRPAVEAVTKDPEKTDTNLRR